MSEHIKLTAARADVLRAVANEEVKHRRHWGKDPDDDKWGHKTVTGACAFLRQVKLIRLGRSLGPSMYASQMWELTEAGQRWLAENGEQA